MGAIVSSAASALVPTSSTGMGAAGSYDPRALAAVKLAASKGGDPAATRKVAQQFESMFLSMMLKGMRATLPGTDPLANEASKMATDMHDQQLAQDIAARGHGIGLADALVAQIERSQGKKTATSTGIGTTGTALPAAHVRATGVGTAPIAASTASQSTPVHRDFVDRFKDAAMAAAEATGLPAKVILGQAALESGWGKHEVRDSKGGGSFNLFGIKAGADWAGATIDAVTTEVVNGVAQKVVQKFKAYSSYAESFTDYATMVASNPRYGKALQVVGDVVQFAREMGKSGYATDPDYGSKLARVLTGPLSRLL